MRANVFRSCFFARVAAATVTLAALCAGALPAAADEPAQASVESLARSFLAKYHLKAAIVQVRSDGAVTQTYAFGESMTGVPAAPAMHFRNGAMAFTYMSTLLLVLVDQNKATLDDKLSAYLPNLPHADAITLRNLANMTSGYADYVYTPELIDGTNANPFRHWTSDELIKIGISKPMMFAPGTNWGYSHTNYVILGRVLEKITGMPLADAMQKYVFDPLGMKQTQAWPTPFVPQPVLHAYSSERRETLGIKPAVPFYEESTFWDPSWTTAEGAVETTDISDMASSWEAIGTGKLLSKASSDAQLGPHLIGFGHADPKCPGVCRKMTQAMNYGLGVVNLGPWIVQTKAFAGCSGTVGYLPAKKLTVAVVVTYAPAAYDAKGNSKDASVPTFAALVDALAPGTLVVPR